MRADFIRIVMLLTLLIGVFPARTSAQDAPTADEGFGAHTLGGSQGAVVRVTNLNDAGPGSLREAIAAGDRTVVFDVAGDIVLANHLYVQGAFITIDGTSAPPPGITLRNYGLIIRGSRGAHDVIVRRLRIRNAAIDGIQIAYGAYNVVIDGVSVQGSADGNLDISEGSHDVTVAWSILAEPAGTEKNSLIKYNPSRITLHHNLFVSAQQRNPQIRVDDAGTPATDTTVDMRNNVVWDWHAGYGTLVWYGARANVVANLYGHPGATPAEWEDALVVCHGDCDGGNPASLAHAYVAANVLDTDPSYDLNAVGNEGQPLPAPVVQTQDACTAARLVLAHAGVRPLDAIDTQYMSAIVLASCPAESAVNDLAIVSLNLSSGTVAAGDGVTVSYEVKNQGQGTVTGTYTEKIYLSRNATLDGDTLIATSPGHMSALVAGATHSHSQTVTIPADTAPGSYFVLVQADALGAISETDEGNNVTAIALTVGSANKDLVVEDLGVSAANVLAGNAVTASYRVANRGTITVTETYTDKIYLSTNVTLDAGDTLLGTSHGHTSDLAAGGTHAHSQSVTIPGGTPAGSYFLLVQADAFGAVTESAEANNVSAVALTVSAPNKDLVIENLGVSATTVRAGNTVTVSYRVANRGTTTVTETYTDKIYLSSNATLDAGDTLLGTSHGHTSDLAAGGTHAHSQSVRIPAGTPPGSYFLLVQADALAVVGETAEGNNVSTAVLTVTVP